MTGVQTCALPISILPIYLLSEPAFAFLSAKVRILLSHFGPKSRKLSSLYSSFLKFWHTIRAFSQKARHMLERSLAPLRRIVARELEQLQIRPGYFINSLLDTLECSHQTWHPVDLADLVNAYTENPLIRARRHRCRPCASLLQAKKPVSSVGIIAARKTA